MTLQKHRSMVEFDLKRRGISDPKVLRAMIEVPRHEFVPYESRDIAYGDYPLPIGEDQTISQPYIVALMTQALNLKGDEKVLEIGTGSGYQAAILSRIVKKVISIERIPKLADKAKSILRKLSYLNVTVITSDGTLGYPLASPYDAIIVTAACFKTPPALIEQLSIGGRIVIPLGEKSSQRLMKITKTEKEIKEEVLCNCMFVPLIGKDGWD
ncbi:protein-L-isoaspartate(D-aspartate) O-methyltransferase [Nanoarchaeota archaeon]